MPRRSAATDCAGVTVIALMAVALAGQASIAGGEATNGQGPTIGAVNVSVAAGPTVTDDEIAALLVSRRLIIPIVGVPRARLRDTFNERRGASPHEALDIAAPRGTPVVAVGDGRIVKLFESVPGGHTIYQFDPDEKFAYYYAHLDAYAAGLREGMQVTRGDLLGFVGTSGNAAPDAPHLHFAIFRLGPERHWWQGAAVNPYRFLNEPER
jgi:murein DD-endopeptidase MepM/ murein hydrolase activator NlpD